MSSSSAVMSSSSHISSSYTFLARAFPFRRSYRSSRPTQPPPRLPSNIQLLAPPFDTPFSSFPLHLRGGASLILFRLFLGRHLSRGFHTYSPFFFRQRRLFAWALAVPLPRGTAVFLFLRLLPVRRLRRLSSSFVFFFCLLSMISRRMRVFAYIPFVSCRFPSDSCVPQALISPGWGIVSYFSLRFIDL